MKRIAVFTSGGDAPGMNAAVRAVVRAATGKGIEVVGIMRGFQGMIEGDMRLLGPRDVANTIQRGGTVLLTARSKDFRNPEGRAKAAEQLKKWDVEGVVCIGGDGSFHGAHFLHEEHGFRVVGLPGTIDNDLYGTDYTIGYFTAVDTALDCIDKLRDTGASHERIFVVEVMGRHAGFIALDVGIASGAEEVLIPEHPTPIDEVIQTLKDSEARGKKSSFVIVAEGYPGGGQGVQDAIEAAGFESRLTILGHVQRGGSPKAEDRILASRLGEAAVCALLEGKNDVMVGVTNHDISYTPLADTWEKRKDVNAHLRSCVKTLSV